MNQTKKIVFTLLLGIGLLETSACGKEASTNVVPTGSLAGENIPLPTSDFGQTENSAAASTNTGIITPTDASAPSLVPSSDVTSVTGMPATPAPSSAPTNKPIPTNTPTPKPTAFPKPTATPTPPPPYNPEISYLSVPVVGGNITVYISKDQAHPQVIVQKTDGNSCSFDWDYNLECGSPIVYITKDPKDLKNLGFPDGEEILAIWLPTEPQDESTFPSDSPDKGALEICGECHCLPLQSLSAAAPDTPQDTLVDTLADPGICGVLNTGYAKDQDTALWQEEEVFSVFSEDGAVLSQYPMLCLPAGEEYPIVYGKIHVTKKRTIYQRFGIDIAGERFWLGQYIDGKVSFLPEYVLHENAASESCFYPWWPRKFADEGENAWLDLDGDGISEEISYRLVTGEGSHSYDFCISINGAEHELGLCSELNTRLFTASLDGKSWQIFVLDYGVGRSKDWVVFQYEGGSLHTSGYFCDGTYQKIGNEEENIYISTASCYPMQQDSFEQKQKFSDGMLSEIPRDYYEFTAMYQDYAHETPHRNVITTKTALDLYSDKNAAETFLLPEGSQVIFLGSDFIEWILVKNTETGEQGWLRVKMENRSAHDCILPDGSVVEGNLLFEGLMLYD